MTREPLDEYEIKTLGRLHAAIKVSPETDCWTWTRNRSPKGYGKFWFRNRQRASHQVAYELLVGPIPAGLQLDHLCRNRACANPAHLEPVTCRENLLRGETLAAKQAALTECGRGHPYSGANLYIRRDNGARECRQCHKELRAARRKTKRDRRGDLTHRPVS